jgi:hypothetical protein
MTALTFARTPMKFVESTVEEATQCEPVLPHQLGVTPRAKALMRPAEASPAIPHSALRISTPRC